MDSLDVHALPPATVIQSMPPGTSSRVAPAAWMSTCATSVGPVGVGELDEGTGGLEPLGAGDDDADELHAETASTTRTATEVR